MTEPDDLDLRRLDATAQRAARGLHEHVLQRVDADQALARVPAANRRRPGRRLLSAAAAIAVLVGSVAVLSDRNGDDDRSRLELDEDGNALPTPQPGTLTALAPHDGKDSIQLPLTVTPSAEGLHDGDIVTVSAPGFEPGESVGIVQCAQEAGGETREQRGGIDGCDISPFTQVTADEGGVATGTYTVQRILTTPITGTVDCAAVAERCLVAMGALNDYDRSGGYGITFAPEVTSSDPGVEIPTLTVAPAESLADGDLVRVTGDGYTPNTAYGVEVCAKDPSGCWMTGESLDISEQMSECVDECPYVGEVGVESDADGHIDAELPVWRFLPGMDPGTYIDCAISSCTLRLSTGADIAPPPAALHFSGGGPGPVPPAVAVDPSANLAAGDTVVVRGVGFTAGSYLSISLCVTTADGAEWGCFGSGSDQPRIDAEGTFAVEFEIPSTESMGEGSPMMTSCAATGPCPSGTSSGPSCGTPGTTCSIRVDAYEETVAARPVFQAVPVPVTFRSAG
jgi:hypothetical protein